MKAQPQSIWVMLNILSLEVRERQRVARGTRVKPLPRTPVLKRTRSWLNQLTAQGPDGSFLLTAEEEALFPGRRRDALRDYGFFVSGDFKWVTALEMFEAGAAIHDIYEACEPRPMWKRDARERALNLAPN